MENEMTNENEIKIIDIKREFGRRQIEIVDDGELADRLKTLDNADDVISYRVVTIAIPEWYSVGRTDLGEIFLYDNIPCQEPLACRVGPTKNGYALYYADDGNFLLRLRFREGQ